MCLRRSGSEAEQLHVSCASHLWLMCASCVLHTSHVSCVSCTSHVFYMHLYLNVSKKGPEMGTPDGTLHVAG